MVAMTKGSNISVIWALSGISEALDTVISLPPYFLTTFSPKILTGRQYLNQIVNMGLGNDQKYEALGFLLL